MTLGISHRIVGIGMVCFRCDSKRIWQPGRGRPKRTANAMDRLLLRTTGQKRFTPASKGVCTRSKRCSKIPFHTGRSCAIWIKMFNIQGVQQMFYYSQIFTASVGSNGRWDNVWDLVRCGSKPFRVFGCVWEGWLLPAVSRLYVKSSTAHG